MEREMKGRVLIAAGSDSGGGAGIQADTKAVTALGGYAMTAITALTAQNTRGVFGIHEVPLPFLRQQLDLLFDDIGADAIKTGMLHSGAVIDTIVDVIEEKALDLPLVVDPVMVAKGGHPLLDPDAMQVLKARLILRAHLLTPNLPEAEILTGMTIKDVDDMHHAAEMLLSLGPPAVLLKGGHLLSDEVVDLLVTAEKTREFRSRRIHSTNTHGTGCTLSSAIACGLAQGLDLETSVERARGYVAKAIATAPGYGGGHGPLNHAHTVDPAA